MVGVAFVSDDEAVVAEQPGDRPFDHPAVFAEFLAGFDALAGDTDANSSVADPLSQFDVVVGFVGVQLVGFAAARAASGLDRGNGPDQGQFSVRQLEFRNVSNINPDLLSLFK